MIRKVRLVAVCALALSRPETAAWSQRALDGRCGCGDDGLMMRTLFALAASAFVLLCSSTARADEECSLVGCSSGVTVRIKSLAEKLPSARKIDVCVAGQCSHEGVYESRPPKGKYVPKPEESARGEARRLHGLGPYPVSVTVLDQRGKVLLRVERRVEMEKFSPNGGGACPPTCFIAVLRLNVGRHALERVRLSPVAE